jgi:hypothetical protein
VPGLGDPRDTQRLPQTRGEELPTTIDNAQGGVRAGTNSQRYRQANRGAMGITLAMGDGGLTIDSVIPNSPAFQAGLRAGDLIIGIDDQSIRTPDDLTAYLSTMAPGRDVRMIVQRDGRPLRVTTRMGAWSDVFRDADQRRTVYSPPRESYGGAQAEIAELRKDLQSLREELHQLRDTLRSVTPKEPVAPTGQTPGAPGNTNSNAGERPPLP